MNNENNNKNEFNQTPMNNQTINSQSQPTNNSQFMSQSFNQQSTVIPQQHQQPQMNYQQPINNQSKKKNTILFLIIGIGALILVALVVLIIVLVNGGSKGNTINDFEDNGIVENEEDETENSQISNEETISYGGFTIPKQNGYVYEIDTDGLVIANNTFATFVEVVKGTLNDYKLMKSTIITQYSNMGYNPTNAKISTYGGKEVLTIEISNAGKKGILYIFDAENSYSFVGVAMNPSNTINYNDVETSVSLLSKAKYTDAYKADSLDKTYPEIKNIFE